MIQKFSNKTEYCGIIFRSKLEAEWAKWFDKYKIYWVYEPEGYKIDNVCYLPDFYLPTQDVFFECKGIMENLDEEKIIALAKATGKDILVGYYPVGKKLHIYDMSPWGKFNPNSTENSGLPWFDDSCDIKLQKCNKCRKLFFVNERNSWECKSCGNREGKHQLTIVEFNDNEF